MAEWTKSGDSELQRPLIASDSTTDDSNTSLDLPLMTDHASTSSSSEITDEGKSLAFPETDSTKQLLELGNEDEAALLSDTRPPRAQRKKKTETDDIVPEVTTVESGALYTDEHDDIESGKKSKRRKKVDLAAESATEIEMSSLAASQRKSVRWTDDEDGGQLHQEHLALSYNRKELSYAPKSKIRVGIFSPLQKKLMIGVGSGCVILLIVLFVVLFVVVKPGASSPTAPPTGGLIPVFREPPSSPVNITSPDPILPDGSGPDSIPGTPTI